MMLSSARNFIDFSIEEVCLSIEVIELKLMVIKVAEIPIITNTISISIKVNPCEFFLLLHPITNISILT